MQQQLRLCTKRTATTRKTSLEKVRRRTRVADHVSFRRYNAIRMVNAQENVREFGQFDVIHTTGLLDYLTDAILVRLIKSLHTTLKPNGVLIAVFKDRDQYATQDHHWLVDWSYS